MKLLFCCNNAGFVVQALPFNAYPAGHLQSLNADDPDIEEDNKGQGTAFGVANGQYEFAGHRDDTSFTQTRPAAHLTHVPTIQSPAFEDP